MARYKRSSLTLSIRISSGIRKRQGVGGGVRVEVEVSGDERCGEGVRGFTKRGGGVHGSSTRDGDGLAFTSEDEGEGALPRRSRRFLQLFVSLGELPGCIGEARTAPPRGTGDWKAREGTFCEMGSRRLRLGTMDVGTGASTQRRLAALFKCGVDPLRKTSPRPRSFRRDSLIRVDDDACLHPFRATRCLSATACRCLSSLSLAFGAHDDIGCMRLAAGLGLCATHIGIRVRSDEDWALSRAKVGEWTNVCATALASWPMGGRSGPGLDICETGQDGGGVGSLDGVCDGGRCPRDRSDDRRGVGGFHGDLYN